MPDETHADDAVGELLPIDPDIAESPWSGGVRRNLAAIGRRWDIILVIALGGMIGAVSRYALSLAMPTRPGDFPWGTFITNVSGSVLLGAVMVLLADHCPGSRYARPFVGTGVIGAYTTFSTYMVESDLLVRDGRAGIAAIYVLASLICGFVGVWLGMAFGRIWARSATHPVRDTAPAPR